MELKETANQRWTSIYRSTQPHLRAYGLATWHDHLTLPMSRRDLTSAAYCLFIPAARVKELPLPPPPRPSPQHTRLQFHLQCWLCYTTMNAVTTTSKVNTCLFRWPMNLGQWWSHNQTCFSGNNGTIVQLKVLFFAATNAVRLAHMDTSCVVRYVTACDVLKLLPMCASVIHLKHSWGENQEPRPAKPIWHRWRWLILR